jgi:1,2-phenylacetyl-CoA epoxidase catalytic subunit
MSRTKEWLMADPEASIDLALAEIAQLERTNATLLAALEAVAADIGDPDSDSWINKPVKLQVLAAIAARGAS